MSLLRTTLSRSYLGFCRAMSLSHQPPSSLNPETYLRFPQFLHEVNTTINHYKQTKSDKVFNKGPFIYGQLCVSVQDEAKAVLSNLESDIKSDLRQLSVACKGLFWQSNVDYTIVPCVFEVNGDFTPANFLSALGLDCEQFMVSTNIEYFFKGKVRELPIVSYQGEDQMNVYKSSMEVLLKILSKHNEVYYVSIGEGVINPSLQFIIAKTNSNTIVGVMSAFER